jgi:alcohol dehydrogenase
MTAAPWQMRAPVRLVFGAGALDGLASHLPSGSIMLVTSPGFTRRGVTARVIELLGPRLVAVMDRVEPNPGIDALDKEAAGLRAAAPQAIVGLGGGSVLDTMKALAQCFAAPPDWTLAAHFRDGAPLPQTAPLPAIAVPTTSGTGSEVTPFATVWDHQARRKHSLARPELFPNVALLDPVLTLGLPEAVTVNTGLDAISQALESIWNRNANAVTLAWATHSLRLALPALPAVVAAPSGLEPRTRIMEASLLAGLAISHTRTAIAHSMSYPLTAHFGVPHGLACSFTLPAVLAFNDEADDGRLAGTARALGCDGVATLGERLRGLLAELDVPARIARYVPEPARLVDLVDEMITPGRADNNLREVGLEDVAQLLRQSQPGRY